MSRQLLGPAAVRILRADTAFAALVGVTVGSDTTYPYGWVFQGLTPEGRPFRDPEGTGKCAVVLNVRDSWASPNAHNNAMFPMLRVSIFADATRDAGRNITQRDADSKAWAVWEVLDRVFHDPGNSKHDWSGVRVVSSVRGGEPGVMDVPGGDGMVRLDVVYNICV